jgi:transposase-like protein
MPKPYSYDLRQKVIQAIQLDGLKISEASQLFNISRNTINLWLKRQAQTGNFEALPNKPLGNGSQDHRLGKIPRGKRVSMGKKPKWRWQNFGMGRLVIALSHGL